MNLSYPYTILSYGIWITGIRISKFPRHSSGLPPKFPRGLKIIFHIQGRKNKMPAKKYECLICPDKHTGKHEDFGKHLMKCHQELILMNSSMYHMTLKDVANNKLPYITIKNNKTVIIPHDEAYLCLCCNMYYNKAAYINKHTHKDNDILTMHNAKLQQYLEQYADKVKYHINGKKTKEDIKEKASLGYEIVYKTVPEDSWSGTSKMTVIVDQQATERNRLAYESKLSKAKQPTQDEPVSVKQLVTEPTGFPIEFMIKMLKQSFKELSVKEEDRIINQRFQNNIMDKFLNNDDITNETIAEEKDNLDKPIEDWEIEGAERELLEIICPKPMLKKLAMSYDQLYNILKA